MDRQELNNLIEEILDSQKDPNEIMAGIYAFGHDEVINLLNKATEENKTLYFFYATQQDEEADVLSYGFK